METKEQSEINQQNQDSLATAQNIGLALYNPGTLKHLIRKKTRNTVTAKLTEEFGADYAADHWFYECDRIIMVHLAANYPAFYGKAVTKDQIEKIKKNYPWEIEIIETVTKMIEQGKSSEQIEGILSLKQ